MAGNETHHDDSNHDEEHEIDDFGMGTLALAFTLGILVKTFLSKYIKLPYTVVILVSGLVLGYLHSLYREDVYEGFNISVQHWAFISPEVILFALLPILIFESAFSTDFHVFLREVWQVISLAVPGVVLATVLTALFAIYTFDYEWSWPLGMVFGAMMSATDPVAVVAILKELGVNERLAVLIEGESLLNDGTSIVVFQVFLSSAIGDSSSVGDAAAYGIRLAFGGPILGVIVGLAGSWFVSRIFNDALSEISVTIVTCYGAFLIAEGTPIHVSGVLAVVFAGLVLSFYGKRNISPSVAEPMHSFWEMCGYLANTLIFFVAGIIMAEKGFTSEHIGWKDVGYLFSLFIAVSVIRVIVIVTMSPILQRGSYPVTWKQMAVMAYSGLRGAVGLTLALIVEETTELKREDRDRILFMMAGIALLTLLVNATTIKLLIHALELDRSTHAETEMFIHSSSAIEKRLEGVVESLQTDRFLGDADWKMVWRYVPLFTSKVYWHRIRVAHVHLTREEEEFILYASARKHLFGEDTRSMLLTNNHAALTDNLSFFEKFMNFFTPDYHLIHRFHHIPQGIRNDWVGYHRHFHGFFEEVEPLLHHHRSQRAAGHNFKRKHDQHASSHGFEGYDSYGNYIGDEDGEYNNDMNGDQYGYDQEVKGDDGLIHIKRQLSSKNISLSWHQALSVMEAAMKFKALLEHQPSTSEDKMMNRQSSKSRGHGAKSPYMFSHGDDHHHHQDDEDEDEELDNDLDPELDGLCPVSLSGITVSNAPDIQKAIERGEKRLNELEKKYRGHSEEDRKHLANLKLQSIRNIEIQEFGKEETVPLEDDKRLEEGRVRILHALKSNFQSQYKMGWLTSTALRSLTEHMNHQLDLDGRELSCWEKLASNHIIPVDRITKIQKLSQQPPFSYFAPSYIHKVLEYIFELASNFIHAHETIHLAGLLGGLGSEVENQISYELQIELDAARSTMVQQLPPFPHIARSLKTTMATRFILSVQREFIEEMEEEGALTEKDVELMQRENTKMMVAIGSHPHFEELPTVLECLKQVPFLTELSEEDRAWIADSGACVEEFHSSSTMLIERGVDIVSARPKGKQNRGWYVVIRGSVRQYAEFSDNLDENSVPTDIRHMNTMFGFEEQLVGIPYQKTYKAATYVHLLFFKKHKLMELAETNNTLRRALWWQLAMSIISRFPMYASLPASTILHIFKDADFIEINEQPEDLKLSGHFGEVDDDGHQRGGSLLQSIGVSFRQTNGSESPSKQSRRRRRKTGGRNSQEENEVSYFEDDKEEDDDDDDDNGTIQLPTISTSHGQKKQEEDDDEEEERTVRFNDHVQQSSYPSSSSSSSSSSSNDPVTPRRHLKRILSSFDKPSKGVQISEGEVIVEYGTQILLLKGAIYPQTEDDVHIQVAEDRDHHMPPPARLLPYNGGEAPCLVGEVAGRLLFSPGSKLFLIPSELLTKLSLNAKFRDGRKSRSESTNKKKKPYIKHSLLEAKDALTQDAHKLEELLSNTRMTFRRGLASNGGDGDRIYASRTESDQSVLLSTQDHRFVRQMPKSAASKRNRTGSGDDDGLFERPSESSDRDEGHDGINVSRTQSDVMSYVVKREPGFFPGTETTRLVLMEEADEEEDFKKGRKRTGSGSRIFAPRGTSDVGIVHDPYEYDQQGDEEDEVNPPDNRIRFSSRDDDDEERIAILRSSSAPNSKELVTRRGPETLL